MLLKIKRVQKLNIMNDSMWRIAILTYYILIISSQRRMRSNLQGRAGHSGPSKVGFKIVQILGFKFQLNDATGIFLNIWKLDTDLIFMAMILLMVMVSESLKSYETHYLILVTSVTANLSATNCVSIIYHQHRCRRLIFLTPSFDLAYFGWLWSWTASSYFRIIPTCKTKIRFLFSYGLCEIFHNIK